MTFNQIPGKVAVFIDANILVYYFAPDPTFGSACHVLIDRIARLQDFSAYTSTHVLSKVAHQQMILEAAQLFGWPLTGITRRLRQHPAEVRKLIRFRQAIDRFHVSASRCCPWNGMFRRWQRP